MCDTYVSLSTNSKDGTVIFGKNSDRLGNEAQLVTYAPRRTYTEGEEVKCTYITIPQVAETAAILMNQPYWMFGCESGVNEYDVVIGNESVATKEPLNNTGLLGMDLLRLGLERSKTAKEALNIIIELLDKHGQGGAHNKKSLNYHNSMIIADPNEAYVIDTAGEWWIVEFIKGFRSISNNLSIRGKGDLRKNGIIQYAIERGYCKDDDDFDFKMIFSSSPLPDEFPLNSRDGCSMNQLEKNKGKVDVPMMMEFLREHEVGICLHKKNFQSVGSQVSHLRKNGKKSIHWFLGNTIPCLGFYKPYVFPIEGQKVLEAKAYSEADVNWYWVQHSEFITPFKKPPMKEIPERNKFREKLKNFETDLLIQVNNLLNKESEISEQNFVDKINSINLQAWDKAYEMIK
jgi:secernin